MSYSKKVVLERLLLSQHIILYIHMYVSACFVPIEGACTKNSDPSTTFSPLLQLHLYFPLCGLVVIFNTLRVISSDVLVTSIASPSCLTLLMYQLTRGLMGDP